MLEKGTRIELVSMANDPDPIPSGSRGTVRRTSDISWLNLGKPCIQIDVDWDDGRKLSLCSPPDTYRVLTA